MRCTHLFISDLPCASANKVPFRPPDALNAMLEISAGIIHLGVLSENKPVKLRQLDGLHIRVLFMSGCAGPRSPPMVNLQDKKSF